MNRFPHLKRSSLWPAALILALPLNAVAAAPSEHDIKAAYLLNILKLVHRKEAPVERKVLTMCLLTPGPVEQPLRALESSIIGSRKLRIRTIQKDENLRSCEVVFLGRSSGQQAALRWANSLGLLTLGNDVDFIPMSGMVALLVEGRKIVVEVNAESVRNPDWVFSSHLLEIARIASQDGFR